LQIVRYLKEQWTALLTIGVLVSLNTVELDAARAALPASLTTEVERYENLGPPMVLRRAAPPRRAVRVHPIDADADPFDYIALCESSGNPSLDTGNGFYGAFQFALATWRSLGLEGKPSDYSYEEQKAAAMKLQALRGWGQWPACARKYGLVKD
jgi:hypothetical protein